VSPSRFSAILFLVFLVSCFSGTTGGQAPAPAPAAADAAKPSAATLQKLYTDYLTREGYRPEIDKDGDVQFRREGRVYFIIVGEEDPRFFRVVLPNFWKIESDTERAKVLMAADASNAKTKVCKIHTVSGNTWASVELFVDRPEDFQPVFMRAMQSIEIGVRNFVEKMRE
jgi:hypothetical protein